MSRVAVAGTGYVGLVTGAVLAELGHSVICFDTDTGKIESLQQGHIPFFEPGLPQLVAKHMDTRRLRFTADPPAAYGSAAFIFVTVGTPPGSDGAADLSHVEAAATEIGYHLHRPKTIVLKSTVPVGTADHVTDLIAAHRRAPVTFDVVSNPEFLREGSAVQDALQPDRIVIGARSVRAARKVARLWAGLPGRVVITDNRSAELIKLAANGFLATKISFANLMAQLCDALHADVHAVTLGMGLDHRIGPHFLGAGLGYGGSCFPKDVSALTRLGTDHGIDMGLLQAVQDINHRQRLLCVGKLHEALGGLQGRHIGLLGVAFKPNTDDLRSAPAGEIAATLLAAGATVTAHDPVAGPAFQNLFAGRVTVAPTVEDLARGADALLLVTEWAEFAGLDWKHLRALMRQPILIDGRNFLDPDKMRKQGFIYKGMGRP